MAFKVTYKASVEKDLAALPKAEMKRILEKIERQLRSTPEKCPLLKGRFAGLRKLRVGDYRIVFAITGKDVLILRIGNRKDVYR